MQKVVMLLGEGGCFFFLGVFWAPRHSGGKKKDSERTGGGGDHAWATLGRGNENASIKGKGALRCTG